MTGSKMLISDFWGKLFLREPKSSFQQVILPGGCRSAQLTHSTAHSTNKYVIVAAL